MMPPMFLSGKIILVLTIFFCCTSIYIYTTILLAIFWFKTIKKSPELSLFYWHFLFDILCSFAMFLNMIIMFLSTTDFVQFFVENPNFAFYIVWPVCLIGSTRALLVLAIEIDRTFATYFPITFFNHRKLLPTGCIIVVILSYGLVDASVIFYFCGEGMNVPPGCTSIPCAFGQCYWNYWVMLEKTIYIATIFFSSLLCVKLFIWNTWKKESTKGELKRANRLALIDTFIIIVFDLVPPMIVTYVPNFYSTLGPINAFSKTMGFVVEGCLVLQNLKRKFSDQKRKVMFSGKVASSTH